MAQNIISSCLLSNYYNSDFFILSANSMLTNVWAKSRGFAGQNPKYIKWCQFLKMTGYMSDFACIFVNIELVDKIKNSLFYVTMKI